MLRVVLLYGAACTVLSAKISLVSLTDLWATKQIAGHHLFPAHDSILYPHFLAIPTNGAANIHMSQEAVLKHSRFRLIHSVCSYVYVNRTYFVANEEFQRGSTELALNLTLDELQDHANGMIFQLLKPSYFCFDPSYRTFHSVWQRPLSPLQHFEIILKPLSELMVVDKELGRAGYYPDCWQVFELNGASFALAIWRKGFGVRYRIQQSESLIDTLSGMEHSDMNPIAVDTLSIKHSQTWWVIWQGEPFTWKRKKIFMSQAIPQRWSYLEEAILFQMRFYNIPSISICVTNSTGNVFEAAFGYSDLRQQKQAVPTNEYRVASISKTVTAMGIAKLINKEKLSLETTVFGEEGILKQYSVHESLKKIRIRHLLEHASGGWSHFQRHEFNRNESDHSTFVKNLVTGYTIHKPPGGVFTYSNIGFTFLGRVIEQITGETYEKFIQRELFTPGGIHARIGDQFTGQHEVTYYSQDNASPYNHWNPMLLDAATGWVFTARQLALLFSELERGRFTEYAMVATRSNVTGTYGRGIQIGDDGSLFHTGSLSGSEAFAVTRGAQVAILCNLRGRQHNLHTGWMQSLAKKILDTLNKV